MDLPENLVDRVLAKLQLSRRPEPTLAGLHALYSAWCRRVPFDNIRKLIHVRRGDPGPLPGDAPEDFLGHWLRCGAGGTCWAGNGALCALLTALGFDARRAIATMLAASDSPPNHGSTTVSFDGLRYLVDASMLHDEPLPLDEPLLDGRAPVSASAAWKVDCGRRDGHWSIRWRPLHKPDGLDCRIERFDVDEAAFRRMHEQSRTSSPFNHELYVRVNRDDSVIGAAFGRRVEIDGSGHAAQRPLPAKDRLRFLIEQVGIHEELALQLPPEQPTPPMPPAPSAPRPGFGGRF